MVETPRSSISILPIVKSPNRQESRLIDWTRAVRACLDTIDDCTNFGLLFGVRPIGQQVRIAAGNDCELRDVPKTGGALVIELPKRCRNGTPLPFYFVVAMPRHVTAIAAVIHTGQAAARFVFLDSFQYLATLRRQGVEPTKAVAALYETLESAAISEDRERFAPFIKALADFHRAELVPRLALPVLS